MPAPSSYSNHELVAQRDGQTIVGQLYLPGAYTGDRPLPTLACAHGLGSNYLHTVPYAWDLAPRGYAVYCFDFCGGGYACKSSGNPINMSLATERDDVIAVLRMLAARPEVDASRLYLMGEGQGGFAATMALHEHPGLARALVLLYPAFHLHDEARRTFPTPKNIPVSYRQRGMRVGRDFGRVAWETNPYPQMRDYPGDVLIVHGDEDAVCPIEYSERAVEVFPHARLQVVHGGRHTFRDKTLEKSLEAVRGFLADENQRAEAVTADGSPTGTSDGSVLATESKPETGSEAGAAPEAVAARRSPTRSVAAQTLTSPTGPGAATAEAGPAGALAGTGTASNATAGTHGASPTVGAPASAGRAPRAATLRVIVDTRSPEAAPTKEEPHPDNEAAAGNEATTATSGAAAAREADHAAPEAGEPDEKPTRAAHLAPAHAAGAPQQIRGRHSVHKTRLQSSPRHFRR